MTDIAKMMDEFSTTYRGDRPNRLTRLAVSARESALNIILEEFKELAQAAGFELTFSERAQAGTWITESIELTHREASRQDSIGMADGLGDIVVTCFDMAHRLGIDLGAVIAEIHRSNMSKLGANGKPIVNDGIIDPTKPVGKILKGPNYSPPNLLPILGITPSEEEE